MGFITDFLSEVDESSDMMDISFTGNSDTADIIVTAASGCKISELFSSKPEIIVISSEIIPNGSEGQNRNTLYIRVDPARAEIAGILSAAVAAADNDGSYDEIFLRWKAAYGQAAGSKLTRRVLLTVLILIILLSSGLIIWSRILSKKVDRQGKDKS